MIATTAFARPTCERNRGPLAYISPSRLTTWLSCPLKFKLRYVEGIQQPTSTSQFLGKRVHEGLEFFYRHRQEGRQRQEPRLPPAGLCAA